MTENKRFVYIEHKGADYILDSPNWDLDYIEMLGDCLEAEEIVDLLNEMATKCSKLEKENEELKQQLLERERMLDVRDKIIKDVMKAVNGDVE